MRRIQHAFAGSPQSHRGVHRVTVLSIMEPLRFQVSDLEAFDGTPILDVKVALEGIVE